MDLIQFCFSTNKFRKCLLSEKQSKDTAFPTERVRTEIEINILKKSMPAYA